MNKYLFSLLIGAAFFFGAPCVFATDPQAQDTIIVAEGTPFGFDSRCHNLIRFDRCIGTEPGATFFSKIRFMQVRGRIQNLDSCRMQVMFDDGTEVVLPQWKPGNAHIDEPGMVDWNEALYFGSQNIIEKHNSAGRMTTGLGVHDLFARNPNFTKPDYIPVMGYADFALSKENAERIFGQKIKYIGIWIWDGSSWEDAGYTLKTSPKLMRAIAQDFQVTCSSIEYKQPKIGKIQR